MATRDLEPFADRRLRFAAALGDAIAVVPGTQEVRRNGDVNYEFRQSSDFFFLTGFDEPDAVATYGADAAYPIEALDEKLREYLIGRSTLFYRLGNAAFDGRITRLVVELR